MEKPLSSNVLPREADPPLSTKAQESSHILFLAMRQTPPCGLGVSTMLSTPGDMRLSISLTLQHVTSDTTSGLTNSPPPFGLFCTVLYSLEIKIHVQHLGRKAYIFCTSLTPSCFRTLIQLSFLSYKLLLNLFEGEEIKMLGHLSSYSLSSFSRAEKPISA